MYGQTLAMRAICDRELHVVAGDAACSGDSVSWANLSSE